ncbi:MAG: ABC transporter substrate-binding protein [Euryarchaeota archaeon]|nr:ABC transporter substrate-binding protein [Euryarchaeota archaeon]
MGMNIKEVINMKTNAILVGMTMALLLLALPAAASDYTLEIFGNANEDDTINMQDVTYTELIILEYRDKTELADGKYDGSINMQDVTQIELIILGREKELTILDSAERTVTVKKPVERVIILKTHVAEAVAILGESDKVVGIIDSVAQKSYYLPEMSKKPIIGTYSVPDYEAIVALTPDIVIDYASKISGVEERLEPTGITAVALNFYTQRTIRSEVEKLGYILNKRNEAKEYNDWCKEHEDELKSLVEGLTKEEKQTVFMEWASRGKGLSAIKAAGPGSTDHDLCVRAGGINIAGDLGVAWPYVEWEWVITENPDVIFVKKSTSPSWCWDNIDAPEEVVDDIKGRPGAELITAVKKNEVYACCAEPLYGLDGVVGLTYWAKLLHPEFDLYPEDIYKEYLERFLGVECPEDLIPVYPPPAS